MGTEIREPMQKRSIETKERIVRAGFALFSEKGFHKTNTAEIARRAGVSTGIVYHYFADKKAVFLGACALYAEQMTVPMLAFIQGLGGTAPDFDVTIAAVIDAFVSSHILVRDSHEEMIAMSHSDPDVAALFSELEDEIDQRLADALRAIGIAPPFLLEKVHIAHGLVENYCHEAVYHKRVHLNYSAMRADIIRLIKGLLLGDGRETAPRS